MRQLHQQERYQLDVPTVTIEAHCKVPQTFGATAELTWR